MLRRKVSIDDILYDKVKERYMYRIPRTYFNPRSSVTGYTKEEVFKKAQKFEKEIEIKYNKARPRGKRLKGFIRYALILEATTVQKKTLMFHTNLASLYIYDSNIDTDLTTLSFEDVLKFIDELRETNIKIATEVKRLLLVAFGVSNEMGLTNFDLDELQKYPQELKKRNETAYIMTQKQYNMFLEYLESPQNASKPLTKPILWSLKSGILIKDLIEVKYKDLIIDSSAEDIVVTGVNIKNQQVQLPLACGQWLANEIKIKSANSPQAENYDDELPLFLTRNRTPLSLTGETHYLYDIAGILNFPNRLNSQTIRYTYIDQAVKNGEEVALIAKNLKGKNHFSAIKTTYMRLKKESL